ncbi:MAG TPA: sigma-70 family RNA polymerase sigma factor [Solirubrobacteraceae bacterium]|jgi:RNA polymerase sigma-70 factor (ECF subfamily)
MELSDEDLLVANTPEAFGEFYDRHARTVLGYFARRTRDPDAAADLVAETFASAIVAQRRFKPGGPPATAWLFAIAGRRLADYQRRGWVDEKTRRSLAMERRTLGEEDREMIRLLADEAAVELLTGLPPDQRAAVVGHVVEERDYAELAGDSDTSEAAVRQRVSRGLATLRRRIGARP